jgi:hypothetical protein
MGEGTMEYSVALLVCGLPPSNTHHQIHKQYIPKEACSEQKDFLGDA